MLVLIGVCVLCLAVASTMVGFYLTGAPAVMSLVQTVPAPVDVVAAAVAEDAAAEQLAEQENGGTVPAAVPGQPLNIRIPAVDLDAAIRSMSVPDDRQLDPPGPSRAYWLSDYGAAGPDSENTTYLAGHTYRDGSAVFNPLLDVPQSAGAVHDGDAVIITTPEGDYSYTVTATALYDKTSVGEQAELWKQVPGRLVIVTCFQYNGGTSSSQNFVVYAQLDGPDTGAQGSK
ncbi:class F sortase [Herbiconiux ginsengi]|uniref:Sortase (Surface protein transpeptidase) n=1 Tax=Herbiconiux ginsengi TaxID=381665 RepID=A0A1H3T5W9_9MICO|nr:class F sortase [Herbiconiux ginsengi]SDZ45241.1 Sortase (surface protein transpeptidase) [Herbiconiux ginsengi]